MTEMNETQTILMEQLKSLGVFSKQKVERTVYNSDKSDGSTWDIRLCIREPGLVVNVDIGFDRGQDLYDVKGHLIRNMGLHIDEVYSGEGFFWDQLGDIVDRAMTKAREFEG
ncbi:hypothetical protein LCGC14_1079930 [marine sediment metagenome]|uniref:Uncharacterized protein n=1 Tax=marine sediment metagenome TaxID=412755 RepID=A0A0F9PYP0_9ZZZZ